MTTYDRYLLGRFLYTYVVLFISTFGLFVVIDGFTNVDGFQEGKNGAADVLLRMADYYMYQSSLFFDIVASILVVLSVMVVFAMLHRSGEIHPILAAGIPTYRLLIPILVGTAAVTLGTIANRELVIPRIAHHLRASRSEEKARQQDIRPVYDHKTQILIGGETLLLGTNRMRGAEFVLPAHTIAVDLMPVRAAEAEYLPATSERPAGWHLFEVEPRLKEIELTEGGQKIVRPTSNPDDLFIVTDVSFDQLYSLSQSSVYATTSDLINRIKNPSFGILSVRSLSLHLHARLTQPLLSFISVLIAVPLIVRKESTGLVANMAVCTGVLGLMFGMTQVFEYLGQVNLMSPSLAGWAPAIIGGTLATWLSGLVQT